MEALFGFIFKAGTLALEAATASDERLKELAAESDAAYEAYRARTFNLERTLDDRNAANRAKAKEKDATVDFKTGAADPEILK